MRWEDERYIRLYTRDTATWKLLPWQGKALLPLLLRKLDRAGIADLPEGSVDGIAALTDMPPDFVEPGLAALIKRGIVVLDGSRLIAPKYMEAQETRATDAARKRASRERARAASVTIRDQTSQSVTDGHLVTIRDQTSQSVTDGHLVTIRDQTSQSVTDGHDRSHAVTIGHSDLIRAEPSCAVLSDARTREEQPPHHTKPQSSEATRTAPSAPPLAAAGLALASESTLPIGLTAAEEAAYKVDFTKAWPGVDFEATMGLARDVIAKTNRPPPPRQRWYWQPDGTMGTTPPVPLDVKFARMAAEGSATAPASRLPSVDPNDVVDPATGLLRPTSVVGVGPHRLRPVSALTDAELESYVALVLTAKTNPKTTRQDRVQADLDGAVAEQERRAAKAAEAKAARAALPPISSPEAVELLLALRRHASLAPAATTADFAEVIEGRRMSTGKPLDWVIAAIDQAGADTPKGWTEEAVRKKVRSYCDNARRPVELRELAAVGGTR